MSDAYADRRRRFEDLVEEVADPVRRYLWRRTDQTTADDVLSETLVVLWRRLDAVPDERIAWAIGVARLQLANAERSRRRQERLVARILTVDPPRETASTDGETESAEAVRAVLAHLRPRDAELLRLWIWDELEPARIAPVLGISVNAATVRLHRARRRFADLWSKDAAGDGHVAVKKGENR